MRVTALTDNVSENQMIRSEHGLSLYIETDEHRILFDTGQTELFSENAEKLGVDLTKADIAVISHGHYDHGGGLKRFLDINGNARVYLNRFAFEPHYNGTEKYIGLDTKLKDEPRLVFTGEEFHIAKGITLYACNKKPLRFGVDTGGLNMLQKGRLLSEDFRHEHYLLVEENGKRVLFSGCSHKGILNIMDWFFPDVFVGGFHFMKLPLSGELKDCAAQLDRYDTRYYTCHCTGWDQYRFIEPLMKRLYYLPAGKTIII